MLKYSHRQFLFVLTGSPFYVRISPPKLIFFLPVACLLCILPYYSTCSSRKLSRVNEILKKKVIQYPVVGVVSVSVGAAVKAKKNFYHLYCGNMGFVRFPSEQGVVTWSGLVGLCWRSEGVELIYYSVDYIRGNGDES